jgi:hypothetical protein
VIGAHPKTRLIGNGAGKGDEIGIAGSDDRLGLIVAGDEADSNCGEISCRSYRTGERHLIAGANWYLLGR